ncbi:MAG: hypothetical protein R3Y62_04010 [Eubacteriales bacterium]
MKVHYIGLFRWILYSVFLLLVAVVQKVVLGNVTLWGTTFSILPVAVAAVSCQSDHESSGIFGLAVGIFWACLGQSSGAAFTLFLPIGALLAGWFCTHYLTRGMGAVLLLGALAVALCEGGIVLQKLYMNEQLPDHFWQLVLRQIVISSLFAPLFWAITKGVERLVGHWKKS